MLFSMGRTKSTYVINHGLASFLKSQLTDDFEKSDIHVFSFDESLNDVTQTWMQVKLSLDTMAQVFSGMLRIRIF